MIRSKLLLSVFAVAFLGLGCATGAGGRGDHAVRSRGALAVQGPSVRALAQGPAVLHAYSQFPGAHLFQAPARAGTDADCTQALTSQSSAIAVGNRRTTLLVAPGSVACVSIARPAGLELLWHAHGTAGQAPGSLLAAVR